MLKKIIKLVLIITVIFLVGGFGSIFFEHYLIPVLSKNDFFSKYSFIRKVRENVTIIEKTEKITIQEDDSLSKIAAQPATTVVRIISIPPSPLPARLDNGVILTSDGIVVTYLEVVKKENVKYKVLLFNGLSYDAEIYGIDEFSNLVFFKINATNLSVISFADSNDLTSGKKLAVIGNSQGNYQYAFSGAMLSNISKSFNLSGKTVASSEKAEGVFELDMETGEGFVGGPVINYNGELVGIMGTQVINNKSNYFVIPSNIIRGSMEKAIGKELGNRPKLGIYYVPVTKEYSLVNGLDRDRGALIYSPSGKQGLAIISGSPAEKAGLRIGDIIIALNGKEINLDNPFSNAINEYKKGDEIELLLVRDKKEMKIKVQL